MPVGSRLCSPAQAVRVLQLVKFQVMPLHQTVGEGSVEMLIGAFFFCRRLESEQTCFTSNMAISKD